MPEARRKPVSAEVYLWAERRDFRVDSCQPADSNHSRSSLDNLGFYFVPHFV